MHLVRQFGSVLSHIAEDGLRLRTEKCTHQVRCIGFRIDKDGRQQDSENIEAV